jgi:alkanesulfonate monooxygenase SsuD/methylene tetrahydromethanopterin reductase-like flavin-dependent oxidoreductase (luciferase family)
MRPILLVAKQLASIDVLSEGRVLLGAGVGWSQDEFQLLGQPFTERGRRLSEAIDLLRQCWLGGRVRHTGEFFDFAEFGFAPSAARPGGIPIVLGGVSDAALRRTAAKGDGWLPINLTPEQLKGRLQNLERLIAEAGREVRDVRIYAQPGSAGPITPDLARDYAAAGVDHLIVEIDWRHEPYDACLKRIRTIAEEFGLQTPHRDGLP